MGSWGPDTTEQVHKAPPRCPWCLFGYLFLLGISFFVLFFNNLHILIPAPKILFQFNTLATVEIPVC